MQGLVCKGKENIQCHVQFGIGEGGSIGKYKIGDDVVRSFSVEEFEVRVGLLFGYVERGK